jgi:hypothetical protein
MLEMLLGRRIAFDVALAVWVLQHCPDVRTDIARIARALAPKGELFVVNQASRAVPTVKHGWNDDGIDIMKLLRDRLRQGPHGSLPAEHTTPVVSRNASWSVFRRWQ